MSLLLAPVLLGLAGGAAAFDPAADIESDISEIATQVTLWSGHCADLEKAKSSTDARVCWWDAAKAISQYTIGNHPLINDVKRLRMGWLWRALQLTIDSAEPKDQGSSMDAQPLPIRQNGPDPARLAGPIACASIILSNYKNCLTETRLVKALPKPAYPRIKKARALAAIAIDKKKTAKSGVTKIKVETTPVRQRIRKKKVVVPAIVRKEEVVALPTGSKVPKRKNFSRYTLIP